MTDPSIFNPRLPQYKTPYGAVPSGTPVTFTLRPRREEGWSRGILTARFEFRDNANLEVPLPWVDTQEGVDLFSGTLDTGDYVGLIWYSLRLEALDGRTLELGEYQLTVYDGTDAIPDWFGQGMSYQIFPDRFHRTQVPNPEGMVGGRWVHQSWQEDPAWRPDERGEVRNRDFFGGNLAGVTEKLDYLASLGVETLYFCPIFEAPENHRYGTADYEKIDPMLGTLEDFKDLCAQAKKRGMHVLLDGVFNHQGFVSKYFNGDGFYPTLGAHQSTDSPYYPWYHFTQWPDQYDAWWGIYSLPAVNESCPGYVDYIISRPDSIIRRYLEAGADGWRLDVADELPDDFIRQLHDAVRQTKPQAVVIGEVWEDGTTKIAYDVRRRHLLGHHLDGLMNYPFRNAAIDYLLYQNAENFQNVMETLRENYPRAAYYSSMNSLGTHDTLRILTLLGVGSARGEWSKEQRAAYRMTEEEYRLGAARLKLGFQILFAFPGSPTVYYGDEAGMEGFEDPFNRQTYPWGFEDGHLVEYVAQLGKARKTWQALRRGEIAYLQAKGPLLAFTRTLGEETALSVTNAGEHPLTFHLPQGQWEDIWGRPCAGALHLEGLEGALLRKVDSPSR